MCERRKGSKESLVALWKHEFFAVYKTKGKRKGKKEVEIYQALEFRMGVDLPEKCRTGLYDKESGEIWVQGVFSIAWTNGCQKFWEVVSVRSGCCVMG